MEAINVDSSNDEDDDDNVSLFPDEAEDPDSDDASLLWEGAEAPIEAEAEAKAEAEAEAILDRIPSFRCSITHAPFKDPVVASDGNTYSKAPLQMWLQHSNKSPVTRENISHTAQYPNIALRNAIEEFTLDMKKIEKANKKLRLAMTTTNKMLNAATAKVTKLESENAIIAEKIQIDADTKWKLVVEETQNKFDKEKAALAGELQSYYNAWMTMMKDNKKCYSENSTLKKALKDEQGKTKLMVDKMKEMIGENEMATTKPKSNKKAKRN